MPLCPACARPVAVARPRCLYCGAALDAEAVLEAEKSALAVREGPRVDGPERVLVVFEHREGDAEDLARALGVSVFDAKQRAARGGFELARTVPAAEADAVAATLRSAGLRVFLIPEAEVRRTPVRVRGGGFEEGLFRLRTEEGEIALRRDDLLLVVRGPITREYQTPPVPTGFRKAIVSLSRSRSATLAGGFLVHLHPRRDAPPFEIDASSFEFAAASRQGSLLELGFALESLGAPIDVAFRKLTPALAPTAKEAAGIAATARALVHASGEGAVILDNVAQFRRYSGWRAAVERQRT